MAATDRQLDAAVAEQLFGWTWATAPGLAGRAVLCAPETMDQPGWALAPCLPRLDLRFSDIPAFSVDIEWAWDVVEAMIALGFALEMRRALCAALNAGGEELTDPFVAVFQQRDGLRGHHGPASTGYGTEAPEAICRAALAALAAMRKEGA